VEIFGFSLVLLHSDMEHQQKTLNSAEINFVNSVVEQRLFKEWIDESCGNFIGWTKEFNEFSLTINRENTATGGLYHVAKMIKGYRSSSDYKSNLVFEFPIMSLLQIKDLLSQIYQNG
jgi:hypothetical protein